MSVPLVRQLAGLLTVPEVRRFTRDSLSLVTSRIVGFLALTGIALAFTRFSTPEIYGQFQYVNAILGVMALFALPGMPVAITRGSARGFDRTLREGTKARLRFSLLGCAALLVLAGVFAFRGQAALAVAMVVGALLFPATAPLDSYLAHLTGKRAFRKVAACEILVTVVPVPLIVAALLLDGRLGVAVLANLAGIAATNALCFAATQKRIAPRAGVDLEDLRYGRRVSGVYIITTAHAHAASLVVGTLLGPASLAVFSIGLVPAEAFRQAMALVNVQLLPRLASATEAEAKAFQKRILAIGAPLALVAGVVSILLLPVLIPLVFTTRYAGSVLYAQILIAGMVLSFWGSQFSNYMRARANLGAQYRLAASAFLVEVLSLAILVRPLGLLGVVLAKGVMRAWHSLYAWRLASHHRESSL